MYIPKHFEVSGIDSMRALMRDHPLATVVTLTAEGLNANHIPLHLAVGGDSPYGLLRGHVARSNPMWVDFDKTMEVLAVFQAANAYVSPSWYATKQQTGRVVPTWIYAVVHAYGSMRAIENAGWIRRQLDALTADNEAGFAEPWAVSDAPHDFVERLIEQIVGIEIIVTRMAGKWKVSQNQSAENRSSVAKGLLACGKTGAAALVAEVGRGLIPAQEGR